jgi:hypothetical protein
VTVIANVHEAVWAAAVAVHRTSVVPTGNNDAEGGVHVTVASEAPLPPTAPPVVVGVG